MSTMTIDAMNRRVYMAGLSLAQFIGYDSTEDFCRHTVLLAADINADEILHFSSADCGAGKVAGSVFAGQTGDVNRAESPGDANSAEPAAARKWSAYWAAAIAQYVPAEYQPQVERYYSRLHIMNLYARGARLDSMEYPCLVGGTTRWVRTTYRLEPMETGHILATVVVIDISRQRDKEQQLTRKATHDGLTGLINRVTAQELITAELAAHPDTPAAIAVIDIDSFKQINDRYGHEHGDRILLNFAEEMQAYFASDVLISRTGGDEFLLYLPDTTQEEAERIIADFAEKEHFGFADQTAAAASGDGAFYFNIAIGYAMFPAQGTDYEHLTGLADEAMYAAKVSKSVHHMQYSKEAMPSHRAGLGFSLRDLAGGMPAGVLVLKANEALDILFANPELVRMLACEDVDDLMAYTGGRFADVLERAATADCEYTRGKLRSKAGQSVDVEAYLRRLPTDHYGDVYYVVLHDLARRGEVASQE